MGGLLKRKHDPFTTVGFGFASITVGAEATNVINVAIALKNDRRKAIVGARYVKVYLSDAATGIGLTATTMTGSPAIGTLGTIINTTVTKKMWEILTDANGNFDLNVGDSGTPTFYLVVLFPDGTIQVSSAITFA